MRPDASRWFARRTLRAADAPPVRDLLSLAGGRTASVVIPALDEEPTIGAVVAATLPLVTAGLVDDVLVVDGGSSDATARAARRAGATVVAVADLLPAHGIRPGKGESMWKALDATDGDLVVYLDADVLDASPGWISGLLWPLLADPAVAFVKACYDRPLATGGSVVPTGGGRVTELATRPLLDLLHPALAGFVQPLAGECAATRALLESLPYAGGYAVEVGLLLDAYDAVGLDGMAQVDLGSRRHRNRDTVALGRMSATVVAEVLARSGVELHGGTLTQFARTDGAYAPSERAIAAEARPPMRDVAEYAARRARAS